MRQNKGSGKLEGHVSSRPLPSSYGQSSQSIMNIYIDLDGTIIDISDRYKHLKTLDYQKRLNNIESLEYLRYDKLFDGVLDTMLYLKRKKHRLILTTLRKLKEELYIELDALKILEIFDEILVPDDNVCTKEDMIIEDKFFTVNNSIIVGDTEVDIKTGKRLGIKTVAVLSGLRTKELLLEENPDYIVDDINDLPNIVNGIDNGIDIK